MAQSGSPKNTVTAARALKRLKSGNANFVRKAPLKPTNGRRVRRKYKDYQVPFAVVLTCADSRVTPEWIFDAKLGDLFVVRVAGNIANTSSIASIEYAVQNIETKLIIVLGHESCGAVSAARDVVAKGGDPGHNLSHLLCHITAGMKPDKPMPSVKRLVKNNAIRNAKQLEARSDAIRSTPDVRVVPAYYSFVSGKVKWL